MARHGVLFLVEEEPVLDALHARRRHLVQDVEDGRSSARQADDGDAAVVVGVRFRVVAPASWRRFASAGVLEPLQDAAGFVEGADLFGAQHGVPFSRQSLYITVVGQYGALFLE